MRIILLLCVIFNCLMISYIWNYPIGEPEKYRRPDDLADLTTAPVFIFCEEELGPIDFTYKE